MTFDYMKSAPMPSSWQQQELYPRQPGAAPGYGTPAAAAAAAPGGAPGAPPPAYTAAVDMTPGGFAQPGGSVTVVNTQPVAAQQVRGEQSAENFFPRQPSVCRAVAGAEEEEADDGRGWLGGGGAGCDHHLARALLLPGEREQQDGAAIEFFLKAEKIPGTHCSSTKNTVFLQKI